MKRKNKLVFITITLVTLVSLYLYERYRYKQPVIYPNFGITIPAGYNTHGIDISRYQCKIDWEEVIKMRDQGQRISFAIAKSTEGTNIIDPYFKKKLVHDERTKFIAWKLSIFSSEQGCKKTSRVFYQTYRFGRG